VWVARLEKQEQAYRAAALCDDALRVVLVCGWEASCQVVWRRPLSWDPCTGGVAHSRPGPAPPPPSAADARSFLTDLSVALPCSTMSESSADSSLRLSSCRQWCGALGALGATHLPQKVRWLRWGHTLQQEVAAGAGTGSERGSRVRGPRTLHLCRISSPCLLICDQRPKTVKAQGHAGAGCRGHRVQGRRSSGDLGGEGFHDRVNLGLVVDLALRLLRGLQHLGL
jgi:hypothetical protein